MFLLCFLLAADPFLSVVGVQSEFASNAAAAEAKYAGRRATFSAWVGGSGDKLKKMDGKFAYLVDNGGNDFDYVAICYLSAEGAKQFAKIPADEREKWKLVGKVKGTKEGAPPFNEVVLVLEECGFVKK